MTASVLSGLINSAGTFSALKATLTATQTSNISIGDHVKFDSYHTLIGTDIRIDTTTAYTNLAGNSIGRFTVKGGKTYRVEAAIQGQFTILGALGYQLYNVTSGTLVGSGVYTIAPIGSNTVSAAGSLIEFVSPAIDTMYEIRIIDNSNSAAISIFSAGTVKPYLIVETVANNNPFSGTPEVSKARSDVVTNLANITWTDIPMTTTMFETSAIRTGSFLTVPASGYYLVNGAVRTLHVVADVFAGFSVNNTFYELGSNTLTQGQYTAAIVCNVHYMNAGDQVRLVCWTDAVGNQTYANNCFLSIAQLR